jgi:hypothetical protein
VNRLQGGHTAFDHAESLESDVNGDGRADSTFLFDHALTRKKDYFLL